MRFAKELKHCKKNFDAWAYNIYWPQNSQVVPLLPNIHVCVEDIKFAYNAWCLLRLSMFYGIAQPSIISSLSNTIPSMSPTLNLNRIFHDNVSINSSVNKDKISIALTPNHPKGRSIQQLDWRAIFTLVQQQRLSGIQFVLGMENGLSNHISDQCNLHAYIPQYGSVGSLSMISALAIALHLGVCGLDELAENRKEVILPSNGHIPLSHNTNTRGPPHESDLVHRDVREIQLILKNRRLSYPLQLGFIVHNEIGDRNIGAIMRNADVYNCEKAIILNRKKFNRRGALGTHRILNITYCKDVNSKECVNALEGYEIWMIYPYYPYLHLYPPFGTTREYHPPYIPLHDNDMTNWMKYNGVPTKDHPLYKHYPHLEGNEVFLDDPNSLLNAVRQLVEKNVLGIILAVSEEGCTPHPSLAALSKKVVYQRHPSKLPLSIQRGLNSALSTAVTFERLRTAIDSFSSLKKTKENT